MTRTLYSAVLMLLVFVVGTGIVFPLAVTGLAYVLFPWQAHGSLRAVHGRAVGSAWIAQAFSRPEYFHPRPSAAGAGYDPTASGGTNLGPTSRKLIVGAHATLPGGKPDPSNFDGIADLAAAYRAENGLAPREALPADAVTRSGSGLDPHISPENARLQLNRVARARGLDPGRLAGLVARHVDGRQLGLLGEPRVDVLELNLDLDRVAPRPGRP